MSLKVLQIVAELRDIEKGFLGCSTEQHKKYSKSPTWELLFADFEDMNVHLNVQSVKLVHVWPTLSVSAFSTSGCSFAYFTSKYVEYLSIVSLFQPRMSWRAYSSSDVASTAKAKR